MQKLTALKGTHPHIPANATKQVVEIAPIVAMRSAAMECSTHSLHMHLEEGRKRVGREGSMGRSDDEGVLILGVVSYPDPVHSWHFIGWVVQGVGLGVTIGWEGGVQ